MNYRLSVSLSCRSSSDGQNCQFSSVNCWENVLKFLERQMCLLYKALFYINLPQRNHAKYKKVIVSINSYRVKNVIWYKFQPCNKHSTVSNFLSKTNFFMSELLNVKLRVQTAYWIQFVLILFIPIRDTTRREKYRAPENFHCTPALYGLECKTLIRIFSKSSSLILNFSIIFFSCCKSSFLRLISFSDSRASNTAAPIRR